MTVHTVATCKEQCTGLSFRRKRREDTRKIRLQQSSHLACCLPLTSRLVTNLISLNSLKKIHTLVK